MGEAGVKSILATLAAAGLLAACSSAPAPGAGAPAPTPTPPPMSPLAATPTSDQCGAAALHGLIGRPKTEIPVPVRPELQRVACTSCPVTLDYNPVRLNFFFDADTGVIKQIRCG
jgi:hypothetical protein